MSNLTLRILSSLVLIPLVLALVFLTSQPIFMFGITALSALAGYEFGSFALGKEFRVGAFITGSLSAFCTAAISFYSSYPQLILFFLPSSVTILFFSFMFLNRAPDEAVRALSFSFFGVFYVGVLISFIGLIPTAFTDDALGRYAVLLLLLGTFLGDTGAYAFGRIFGKHKLSPRLSPQKTWEGSLGGFLSTFASVMFVRFFLLPNFSILQSIFLSLFLSFFCQTGDLAESFVKRGVGVKDTGRLIPGHGGLLDRIDALLFGAPVVYVFSLFY